MARRRTMKVRSSRALAAEAASEALSKPETFNCGPPHSGKVQRRRGLAKRVSLVRSELKNKGWFHLWKQLHKEFFSNRKDKSTF